MNKSTAIIHACSIPGDGTSKALKDTEISAVLQDEQLAWVHLDVRQEESREWLKREISYLDQIIIDALLAEETRPRVLEFKNGLLLILRGVNLNEDALPEDMVSIRIWVDPYRIISIQTMPLM